MPVDGEKGVMVFMNVLNIEHVSKIFGDKKIFDDISYGIHDGDKIGIIGINGTGKSTLLKIIAGEEETDEGQVISQNGLRITYLPQMPDFPKGAIVQDYVADGKWQKDWSTESEARNILNKLGITEHDVPVEQLSGGQKKRVALARTLVNPSDVLILDEPTNHLDNEMVTWLEDYLNRFKGVVIMVTHDRYFLDRVVRRIFALEDTRMVQYEGGYTDYANRKAAEGNTESTGTAAASQPKNADEETTSKNWKNGQKRKLKFTYQEQKDYESIEGEMAALEDKIATLEADFSKYASDFVKLNELTQEKEAAEQQLEEKMERWMYLEDLAARIERGEEN